MIFILLMVLTFETSHSKECAAFFQKHDLLKKSTKIAHGETSEFLSLQIRIFSSKLRQLEKIDTSNVSPQYVMEFRDFLQTAIHLHRKKQSELSDINEFSYVELSTFLNSMTDFSKLTTYEAAFLWMYGRTLSENFLLRNQMRALEGVHNAFFRQPHMAEFYKLKNQD